MDNTGFWEIIAIKLKNEIKDSCDECGIEKMVCTGGKNYEIVFKAKPKFIKEEDSEGVYGKEQDLNLLDRKLVEMCFSGLWELDSLSIKMRKFRFEYEGNKIEVIVLLTD